MTQTSKKIIISSSLSSVTCQHLTIKKYLAQICNTLVVSKRTNGKDQAVELMKSQLIGRRDAKHISRHLPAQKA